LVVVTGVGTGIGKTHVGEALLFAWGRRARVVGLKPIESGLNGATESDAHRLARASTFHVKRPGVALRQPVSPHLAARNQNVRIPVRDIICQVEQARNAADGVLVELAGGLFTPITDDLLNADLASALRPDVTLLIAPDRLGVLHDTIAAVRAAANPAWTAPRIHSVLLIAPERGDASTGTNAAEIPRFTGIPVSATLPRAPSQALSAHPAIAALVASW